MPSIGSTTQRTPLVPVARRRPPPPARRRPGRAASSRPTISSSLARVDGGDDVDRAGLDVDVLGRRCPAPRRPAPPPPGRRRRRAPAARPGRGAGGGRRSRRDPAAGPARAGPRTASGDDHYPVGVQGFGVDIGGSGIKGCLVDLDAGQLIGERVRIETPQPSLPDPVYAVVAQIVDVLRLDRADRRHLPRRHEARGRAHRRQRRQELDRHRRRRRPVRADPRRRRHAQRRRRGRDRRDALRRGPGPEAASS